MQKYVDVDGIDNVCGYVNWAYTESVDLKSDIEAETPLDSMYSTCQKVQQALTQSYNTLETTSLSSASSNEVRQRLANQILVWIKDLPQTSDALKKQLAEQLKNVDLKGTAGTEHPNYVLFWTNEELLSLIA